MYSCCKKNIVPSIFKTIFWKRSGPWCPNAQSDEQLNEYIKSKAETAYHPCGTLKMGVDQMAVVDENLKISWTYKI